MNERGLRHDAVLKSCFGVDSAPCFTTLALGGDLSVTRIRCDTADNGLSNPLPREDAWLMTMQLRDCAAHDLWLDDKAQPTGPLATGAVSIYDLRRDPRVNSISPFANLHFRLPMRALNAIAEQNGFKTIVEIPNDPGLGFEDPVISGLGMALVPMFDRHAQASQLFVDHIAHALVSHLAQRFSGWAKQSRTRTILSNTQRRNLQDLIEERLNGEVTLAELGEAAGGLSGNQVGQAFLDASGELPHRWLMRRRVERALDLIRSKQLPLADIARRCGFVDVAHLQRVIAASGRLARTVRH